MVQTRGRLEIHRVPAALIAHGMAPSGQEWRLYAEAVTAEIEAYYSRTLEDRLFTTHAMLATRAQFDGLLPKHRGLHLAVPDMIWRMRGVDGGFAMAVELMSITPEVALREGDGGIEIVTAVQMPETALAAAPGRPLSSVISHPALNPLGLMVTGCAEPSPDGEPRDAFGMPRRAALAVALPEEARP